jgi:tetratricopeptide (TPR) repeat protein
MILFLAAAIATQPSTAQVVGDVACLSRSGADQHICLATRYSAAARFADAAAAFEKAAGASGGGVAADRALAAAGNMWIAAGEPGKAALALDRALRGTGLQAEQRGEALLDRARAAEAQNDLALARTKLNDALATIAADPFYWYFSAALAIREGDKATAQSAIAKALTLAPSDPTVLFEAGHVAHFLGDADKARSYWMRAAGRDPNGPTGKAAAKAIELLGVTPTVKTEPQARN